MRSLAYHEAIPGHHTQIAIAMDQDLPMIRKIPRSTGFIEGWALYAERLAWELGWHDDPYSNLGRLQYEAAAARHGRPRAAVRPESIPPRTAV